jgi:hypothetical protein
VLRDQEQQRRRDDQARQEMNSSAAVQKPGLNLKVIGNEDQDVQSMNKLNTIVLAVGDGQAEQEMQRYRRVRMQKPELSMMKKGSEGQDL